MKKYLIGLVLVLTLFTLVGCGTKKEDNKKEDNKEEVNVNSRYGLKSTVVDGKKPYNLDEYPTIKDSAINIEDTLLKYNYKIKEILLDKITDDYIKVDYKLDDDYYVYFKFNKNEQCSGVTYRNSDLSKVKELIKILINLDTFTFSDTDEEAILKLEVDPSSKTIGNNTIHYYKNDSNEYVFQIVPKY